MIDETTKCPKCGKELKCQCGKHMREHTCADMVTHPVTPRPCCCGEGKPVQLDLFD